MATPSVLDFRLNTQTPDYLQKSFAAHLVRYSPQGSAPIFAFTSVMNSGEAKSVEHGYFSKTMLFPKATLTANATDSATSLTVNSTADFVKGDILLNWTTNEPIRVVAIVDATTLTVARGYNATDTGLAMTSGQVLYSIGNAFEQGSYRPAARNIALARVLNRTQIFRNSWALAHSLAMIQTIVGKGNIAESKLDCAQLHGSAIETAIIFGQMSSKTVEGQYFSTMDGIVSSVRKYAPGNIFTAGPTTNFSQLEAMLNVGFNTVADGRYSMERALYVGSQALTVINNIGRKSGQYQLVDGQTNFGMQFLTFRTSRGIFRMVEHPILNSNDDWKKMALALDLGSIKLMYLTGRRHLNQEYGVTGALEPGHQGVDAVGGTLTAELTLEVLNPSAHVILFNLTEGVHEPTHVVVDNAADFPVA